MPLGLSPLATGPTGASPLSAPTVTTSSGVAVPVLGLSMTSALGSVSTKESSSTVLLGLEATLHLGLFGITTPNMTSVLLSGLSATASVGYAVIAAGVEVAVEGVQGNAIQAPVANVAVGSVVLTGVEATSSLGAVVASAPQRWVEINPVSTPSWSDISIVQ